MTLDRSSRDPGSEPTLTDLDRDNRYAFAEFHVPIISPGQNIPGIRRLELNIAARYEDFSDIGENTSPKIGILWSPVAPLKIRGTFGESFRPPFLTQLIPAGGFLSIFSPAAFGLPDIWNTDNSSTMLLVSGTGKQNIGPEQAQTFSFGFDFDLSGLSISATYFDIDYTDRIAVPDPSGGFVSLLNPQDFPLFFDLDVTVDQIETLLEEVDAISDRVGVDLSDPAAVQAVTTVLFDNREQNLASTETDGIDLNVDYTMEAFHGNLSLGFQATKTFTYDQIAFENSLPFSVIDTVLFPADFKGRAYIGLTQEQWQARLNVNYVDDYDNPFDLANPTVDSWTTADVVVSYEFPKSGRGMLDGVRFGLTVQNVFDVDPPFVPLQVAGGTSIQFPIGFDPANANPFGRIIDVQVSKQW